MSNELFVIRMLPINVFAMVDKQTGNTAVFMKSGRRGDDHVINIGRGGTIDAAKTSAITTLQNAMDCLNSIQAPVLYDGPLQ